MPWDLACDRRAMAGFVILTNPVHERHGMPKASQRPRGRAISTCAAKRLSSVLEDALPHELVARARCGWVESERDSRISEILIQPVGWAEASRRWQSVIRKTCVTA
jgi:hypothetical protein